MIFLKKRTPEEYADLLVVYMNNKLKEKGWSLDSPHFDLKLKYDYGYGEIDDEGKHLKQFKQENKIENEETLAQILTIAKNSKYISMQDTSSSRKSPNFALTNIGYQRANEIREKRKEKNNKIKLYIINIIISIIVAIFSSYITNKINANNVQNEITALKNQIDNIIKNK